MISKLFIDRPLGALERFRSNIREIVSEFRFLPESIPTDKLEALSFELRYDGSKHALKSVRGFEVSRWQLSHVLTTAAVTRLFVPAGKTLKKETQALGRLLHGVLGLKFYDMWEKIFAVYVLGEEFGELRRMHWKLRKQMKSVHAFYVDSETGKSRHDNELTKLVQRFYRKHLDLSLAMNLALVGIDNPSLQQSWTSRRDRELLDFLEPFVQRLCESNLIRHSHVGSPLINFTDDDGDWTVPRTDWDGIDLLDRRINGSPRFIHRDEFEQAELLTQLGGNRETSFAGEYFEAQFQSREDSRS